MARLSRAPAYVSPYYIVTVSLSRTVSDILSVESAFKVIENATIRKLGYGFLFAFHSNYGAILYHFRDKAMKIAILHISEFDARVRRSPSEYCRNIW